jgi:uncharacterized ParB-like nuclease family protein
VANKKEIEMSDAIKLKATVMWAQLHKINEMSGKYQVNLCNLSDAAVEALKEIGIEALEKEGHGKFITCKSANPMKAFDNNGNEITENIGNGSKAVAVIKPYEWKYKNKTGISASMVKLVVTEFIPYGESVAVTEEDAL